MKTFQIHCQPRERLFYGRISPSPGCSNLRGGFASLRERRRMLAAMYRTSYGMWAATALGVMLAAAAAGAQTHKLHEYRLHEQEERGAPFGMTLGPDHTLYTVIPRRDGNWVLSEVKNWWQSKPEEIGILVEGFSNREPVASMGQMTLAVTSDAQTLVSILSAEMQVAPNDPFPTEMVVEAVRLQDFSVVNTQRMRGLGMRGHLQGGLDRAGHLLVRSEIAAPGGSGSAFATWFSLAVPELKAQLVCSNEGGDQQAIESACGAFAKNEGYASAADLAGAVWPAPPASPPALPAGVSVAARDRWQAASVTIEGKPLTVVVINGVQLQVYGQQ